MPLHIVAETPSAGGQGHRYVASPGAGLDSVQAGAAVREVADGAGVGACRTVAQADTGRESRETIVLVGIDPAKWAALRESERAAVRESLATRLPGLAGSVARVDWAAERREVAEVPGLAAWIELGWAGLATEVSLRPAPMSAPRSEIRSPRVRRSPKWWVWAVSPKRRVWAALILVLGLAIFKLWNVTTTADAGRAKSEFPASNSQRPEPEKVKTIEEKVRELVDAHGGDPRQVLRLSEWASLTDGKKALASITVQKWLPNQMRKATTVSLDWPHLNALDEQLKNAHPDISRLISIADKEQGIRSKYQSLRAEWDEGDNFQGVRETQILEQASYLTSIPDEQKPLPEWSLLGKIQQAGEVAKITEWVKHSTAAKAGGRTIPADLPKRPKLMTVGDLMGLRTPSE